MNCNHLHVHKHTHSHFFSYNLFFPFFFFFLLLFFTRLATHEASLIFSYRIAIRRCNAFFPRFSFLLFSSFPLFLIFLLLLFRYKRKTSLSRKVTFKILNEYPLFTSKIINVSLNPCRNVHSCIYNYTILLLNFRRSYRGSTRSSARNWRETWRELVNFLLNKKKVTSALSSIVGFTVLLFSLRLNNALVEHFSAIEIVASRSPSLPPSLTY